MLELRRLPTWDIESRPSVVTRIAAALLDLLPTRAS
jgi:hypothetical protein